VSKTRPHEETLVAPARSVLAAAAQSVDSAMRDEAVFQILEAAAAKLGGFDYAWYRETNNSNAGTMWLDPQPWADALVQAIRSIRIHPALLLAALSRPNLPVAEQRTKGVYYTDFRLAAYLARPLTTPFRQKLKLIDPACGTGTLLVAAVLALLESGERSPDDILAKAVYGADISAQALRGTALALASLTKSQTTITRMRSHIRQHDSLVAGMAAWSDVAPYGFDLVIGNPPWEKLKVSRHEFLKSNGVVRHYGAGYEHLGLIEGLDERRQHLERYIDGFADEYDLQGQGEQDLYKLFIELALTLAKASAHIALLVPAGLIRSQGTAALRKHLFAQCSKVEITVLHNHARFFGIDTRFKFVALQAKLQGQGHSSGLVLYHGDADESVVFRGEAVPVDLRELRASREDLSVPELRNPDEWHIFRQMCVHSAIFNQRDGPWHPKLAREVDMTNDRVYFRNRLALGCVPLIEGRMLHQYTSSAKRHVSGTGRRAVWEINPPHRRQEILPQFWYPLDELPDVTRCRVGRSRVGFCDITGQTNERTMLAARIPSGVVCGNKVPTILFDTTGEAEQEQFGDCWLAIVNSFSFDWLLRRVVTTTINYFILLAMPMPLIQPSDEEGQRLATLSATISSGCVSAAPTELWQLAEARAEIEWRVLAGYGQDLAGLEVILGDFPLLDRAQLPLPGEKRSTITRDLVLLRAAEALNQGMRSPVDEWRSRVEHARELGAIPFIPSHFGSLASLGHPIETEVVEYV
jgi:methylase of polypeptide subunit release factors